MAEILNNDGTRNWQAAILLDNVKQLEAENEELKKQLEQKSFKKYLDYGQGYKVYATEKGVFVE